MDKIWVIIVISLKGAYLYKKNTPKKTFLQVKRVTSVVRITEGWPWLGRDKKIIMAITNRSADTASIRSRHNDENWSQCTNLTSPQSYSPGQSSRPVWSPKSPLSSFEFALNAGCDAPYRSLTHSTTANLSFPVSSPRAISDPWRNCNVSSIINKSKW